MWIVLGIAIFMVNSMLRTPPQHTLLRAGLRKKCEDKLTDARSFEGTVRKVSVISGSDKEHSGYIQHDAQDPVKKSGTRENRQQGDKVDGDKGSSKNKLLCRAVDGGIHKKRLQINS